MGTVLFHRASDDDLITYYLLEQCQIIGGCNYGNLVVQISDNLAIKFTMAVLRDKTVDLTRQESYKLVNHNIVRITKSPSVSYECNRTRLYSILIDCVVINPPDKLKGNIHNHFSPLKGQQT